MCVFPINEGPQPIRWLHLPPSNTDLVLQQRISGLRAVLQAPAGTSFHVSSLAAISCREQTQKHINMLLGELNISVCVCVCACAPIYLTALVLCFQQRDDVFPGELNTSKVFWQQTEKLSELMRDAGRIPPEEPPPSQHLP